MALTVVDRGSGEMLTGDARAVKACATRVMVVMRDREGTMVG